MIPENQNIPSAEDIAEMHRKLKGFVNTTPVFTSSTLNHKLSCKLYFKCENFQKSGAFKFRGANSAIEQLSGSEKEKGVCTHSSGNHAQALALAAQMRGIAAHIVMPSNAPIVKVNAVKSYGGIITFCEPTLQAREQTLEKVKQETGATLVHPYNDYRVIQGQASCFLEMLEQMPEKPEYIITPLGGGGLLSGTILTARYFSPQTRIIGAEPLNANDAWQSFRQKKFIPSLAPQTIADGLKTSLGSLTYPIIMEQVDDILTATEQSIIDAMFLVWERMKLVIEPSAAVPLAAMMENPDRFANKKVGIIFSGGNIDLHQLPWM